MKLITVSILNMSKLIWWSLIAAPLCLSLSMSEFNVPEFAHFGKRVVLKVRIWMERYKSILSFRAMFECVYLFAEYCISVRAPVVIQWRAAGECEVVQGDNTGYSCRRRSDGASYFRSWMEAQDGSIFTHSPRGGWRRRGSRPGTRWKE